MKLWDLARPSAPIRTIQTDSYTFFKMQLCEEAAGGAPMLLLPCEASSNLSLVDLRAPPSAAPAQLIECEKPLPRNTDLEEQMMSRMDEKEAEEMKQILANRPTQYERKVGIVMAAKFFQPQLLDAANSSASSSSSSAASSSSASGSLPALHVAWGSESGIFGVWDIRAAKHLFQQSLHKDTSQIRTHSQTHAPRYGHACHCPLPASHIHCSRSSCMFLCSPQFRLELERQLWSFMLVRRGHHRVQRGLHQGEYAQQRGCCRHVPMPASSAAHLRSLFASFSLFACSAVHQ